MRIKELEKGIVIFACGHALYGRAAYNLAMSLKAMGPVEICVLTNGRAMSHISVDQLEFFDHVVKIPDDVPASTICKLYANQFSPFKKTIVLDADMLWLPYSDPANIFDQFENCHFTAITEGKEDDLPKPHYFFWADVNEIKEKYTLKSMLHQWRSEFIYFDEEGGAILDRALEIVKNPGLSSIKLFGHNVPDELGINIATAEAGIVPHKYRWAPAYWSTRFGNRIPALRELKDKYCMMSFGSHTSSPTLKGVYDVIMKNACAKLGKQHIFRLMDKQYNIPERKTF